MMEYNTGLPTILSTFRDIIKKRFISSSKVIHALIISSDTFLGLRKKVLLGLAPRTFVFEFAADVVINKQQITWDIFTKLHQFIASSHVGLFMHHDKLMDKLYEQVAYIQDQNTYVN